uniref:Kinesin-like protein n=1 Tax=Angiostrongylus cantonensis TaxID=6313 RepID=A0A0K0D7A0_ANGCA
MSYYSASHNNVTPFQQQIFEDIGSRIVDGCVDGYNGTVFAYGQTGSGKTYTMFGPSDRDNCLFDSKHRGLMPRACDALFEKLYAKAAEKGADFNYEVSCRFVELYNEEFYDLLSQCQQKLSIRSDSKVAKNAIFIVTIYYEFFQGVQLLGIIEHRVQSSIDMMRLLEIGREARRTAETAMNRESSRSHCIFSVEVKTEELLNNFANKKSATLHLVDLAGSERQTQSNAVSDRFKEGININRVNGFLSCGQDFDIDYYLFQSLSVLGRVIRTLSGANRRAEHIPYRDSKLTLILRDSLGGNSRTAVIVNVHPDRL